MYQVTTGIYDSEGEKYTSFGIQCGDVVINDISLDKTAVEALVALCNDEKLSLLHLPDIVSDFLETREQLPLAIASVMPA